MSKPPSWRKLEAALERVARTYGHDLDRDSETGDLMLFGVVDQGEGDWNLTMLAKDLEKELS